MPTDDTMTTKRMSVQQQHSHHHHHLQQQQQQHQRRPPDVEEALSSMLWTPYERASTTDTSSDDDDDDEEQLQCQLKKSKSQYDYRSVPTTVPPLTPPPPELSSLGPPSIQFPIPPTHLMPTNIMAFITAATPQRAASAAGTATSLLTTSTTNAYYTAEDLCDPSVTTPLVPFSNLMLNVPTTTTTALNSREQNAGDGDVNADADDGDDDANSHVAVNDVDDNDDDDDNNVIVNAVDTFNDVFNNDNTLAATSSSMMMMMSSYQKKNRIERIPSLTKWWSASNTATATATQTRTSSAIETGSAAAAVTPSPPASTSTAPLTNETNKQPPSYESLYKKPSLRPLRQRHRFNKHLNLFKPVFDTFKANVATVTHNRFASLTRTDHNRVTNNTPTPMQPANNVIETILTIAPAETTATTTLATSVTTDNNCDTDSTSNNLVHSFTDNFLHEHLPSRQHVSATNVDNEHVINVNINNNYNNNTTIENTHGVATTTQQQQGMTHHQQHTNEQIHNDANGKPKQNQENENKQNNNFIICRQQLQTKEQEMKRNEFTIDQREIKHSTMNYQHKNTPLLLTTTNSNSTTNNTASLFYDSSSAISLTRSFEANTSYTFGLTLPHDTFETDLQDATRKTTTTYSLTPNKCLAELERLYAEFRASESLREQKLRESQKNLETTATDTMRLNVPASNTNSFRTMPLDINGGKTVNEMSRLNPSTSSVFLTTTNSVTTLTNPCQRTPSLTIQVNQSDNNSNNNNNNNNNNHAIGQHENQAIVNTTSNGVSVINCNYMQNNNNNNSNNNNNNSSSSNSITNVSDSATNTTNETSANYNVNSFNNNNNHCSPNQHTNLKNISKNINNNCNSSSGSGSGNSVSFPPPPNCLVPQVLNAKDIKDQEVAKNIEKQLRAAPHNAQVKVIQVNEGASSSSSTPTSSPKRTFTSTECQTDDISAVQLRPPAVARQQLTATTIANSNASANNNRDQRRRERRERRHLQHTASLLVAPHPHAHPMRHGHLDRHSMPAPPLPPILHPPHLHHGLSQTGHTVAMLRPMLPDILHNHFPPPYSALPGQSLTSGSGTLPHHHNRSPIPFSHPLTHHPPPQTPTATILGPPPPPPPAGTTLLTSVISTVPIPGATPIVSDGRFTLPLPIIRRSPSERSGKGCCGQWFAGPPLRALIAVVALGGVACALGGAALGATGLAGPPNSHFTAALLMIGVGVVLVTVSGAAWRMTAPGGPPCLGLGSSVDLGRCGRRPCSRGGGAPQGLLYPEFQHRPPPPSYQASMQEYRLRLLLLDRDRQNGVVRGSSPPPTYRSHAGSLLRAPLTTTARGTGSGNRCESSIGGSEYSFPPSYRSRNNTPGTISSERSIETEPSGRLLANEDIPEPLSVEQLSEYNSLQQRCNNHANVSCQKSEQKRNSIQLDTNVLLTKTDTNLNNLNSDKKDDLVTIVTITPHTSDSLESNENRLNNEGSVVGGGRSESREHIEILAHL